MAIKAHKTHKKSISLAFNDKTLRSYRKVFLKRIPTLII